MKTFEKIDDGTAKLIDATPREEVLDIQSIVNKKADLEARRVSLAEKTAALDGELAAEIGELDILISECKKIGVEAVVKEEVTPVEEAIEK